MDDDHVLLSLAEAAQRHGLSESHLSLLLRNGAIPGAQKVPGKRGREWRVTSAGVEAAGYPRTGWPAKEPLTEGHSPDLAMTVRTLSETIARDRQDHERLRNRYAELLAKSAATEAKLQAELKAERNRRRHAEEEVKRLTKAPSAGVDPTRAGHHPFA